MIVLIFYYSSIIYSDTLLAHLLLFSSDCRYYNLNADGSPLFTMSVIQSKPVISVTSGDDRYGWYVAIE